MTLESFVAKWAVSGAAEDANSQLFVAEQASLRLRIPGAFSPLATNRRRGASNTAATSTLPSLDNLKDRALDRGDRIRYTVVDVLATGILRARSESPVRMTRTVVGSSPTAAANQAGALQASGRRRRLRWFYPTGTMLGIRSESFE